MLRRIALTTAVLAMLSLSPGGVATGQPVAPGCPWTTVPSPNGGAWENRLQDVAATSRSDAWAVGWYTHNRHGPTLTLTEHWDGHRWRIVSSPSPGTESNQLWGVSALSRTDAWAVGTTSPGAGPLVEHWDGTSWSVVPAPSPSGRVSLLYDVSAAAANDVWAVGFASNQHATPIYITLTEHWNGTDWSIVPSPNTSGADVNELFGVAAFPTGEAFAVGNEWHVTPPLQLHALALRWTGSSWAADPMRGGSSLSDVGGITPNDVWAVGGHGRTAVQTLIQHWDGTAWTEVPSPNPSPPDSLEEVAVFSRSSALAIGQGPLQKSIAESWNGRAWRVPTGTPASFLFGLAPVPGTNDALAVGLQDAGPAHTVTLVQRYCLG